jgi:2-polyprenyl-6-methoxyphenol hydroxylase-like FAD-dependent oxidoreductase
MVFFERKTLLEIMYNSHPNKSKLLSNKHVQSIEEEENGVKVTTKDGSVYEGDIVIGADGVWSTVRQSMWQIMENSKLSNDLAKDLVKDKNGKLNRGCSLKFSSTMKYLN